MCFSVDVGYSMLAHEVVGYCIADLTEAVDVVGVAAQSLSLVVLCVFTDAIVVDDTFIVNSIHT